MNIVETIVQIESQLEQIQQQEQTNQQEQEQVNQRILDLESKLRDRQQRRSQLDRDALHLHTQAEELKLKLDKLRRIANLSKEFLDLHAECQDNEDLLNTLYSTFSTASIEVNQKVLLNSPLFEKNNSLTTSKGNKDYSRYSISIEEIKHALPQAEKIYQKLVTKYLEEYKTHQNFIMGGLDVIWYAVAFIAFGRSSYRKMSFKYHPDRDGSLRAMQVINTAWSISQSYLNDLTNTNDSVSKP